MTLFLSSKFPNQIQQLHLLNIENGKFEKIYKKYFQNVQKKIRFFFVQTLYTSEKIGAPDKECGKQKPLMCENKKITNKKLEQLFSFFFSLVKTQCLCHYQKFKFLIFLFPRYHTSVVQHKTAVIFLLGKLDL